MAGVRVRMPDGAIVELPENPTPAQMADIEANLHPQAATEVTPQRDTTPKGLALEALKGAGRGALGTARAIGQGMASGEDHKLFGQSMMIGHEPELERLNKQVDQLLARDPDASTAERGAGLAGEIGGGMLFGGGPGSNPTLARGLLLPNSYALPGGQQSLFGPIAGAVGQYAAGKSLSMMGIPGGRSIAGFLAQMLQRRSPNTNGAMPLPSRPMLEEEAKRMLAMGSMGPLFADDTPQAAP